jgi:hypothetical protein
MSTRVFLCALKAADAYEADPVAAGDTSGGANAEGVVGFTTITIARRRGSERTTS